jgi:DNA adenine methylase
MKTPVSYYGGKQNMVKHILPLLPEHKHYIEPFFGGGAVFFSKEPSQIETINDISDFVIVFFRQVKSNFDELKLLIDGTAHSRSEYMRAMSVYKNPMFFPDIAKAWAFYITTQMGSLSHIGSWYSSTNSKRYKGIRRRINNFSKEYAERLEQTQIECKDAIEVIKQRDTIESFYFIDPPYINSNQGHYNGYTETDYKQLLETLQTIKGKFLLCGYPSEILDTYLAANSNWNKIAFDKHNCGAAFNGNSAKKTEVIVKNYL